MAGVLLVGTDRERIAELRALMRGDGHEVLWHRGFDDWRVAEREMAPDVVVAPVESCGPVLGAAGRAPRGFAPPLLLVQGEAELTRNPFLSDRLVDRVASPFTREELLARVDALVRACRVIHRRPATEDRAPRGMAAKIAALIGARSTSDDKPTEPYLEVAARLAEWGDRRDAFEPGHQERVTGFCGMIAEGLGLGSDETTVLLRAAMLHDIGKVALPLEMLHQTGPLDENQRRLMQTHPQRGASVLRALVSDDTVARVVLYHHERPDGSGYYGREAANTPRAAAALAVAEVYDAMTSSKVTETMDTRTAIAALREQRGESLDADCVDALVDNLCPNESTLPLTRR